MGRRGANHPQYHGVRHRISGWVLGPFLSDEEREEILGFLEDVREARVDAVGPWRAASRYWLDLAGFLWTTLFRDGAAGLPGPHLGSWRQAWHPRALIRSLGADVRFSFRSYASTPLTSLLAFGSIVLGIGANTAIFGLADALLFRPMAISRPDRVVAVFRQSVDHPDQYAYLSYPDYETLRASTDAFQGVAAYAPVALVLGSGSEASEVGGLIVSGDFFSVLGLSPSPGRGFLPEETHIPGGRPVVVVSRGFSRRYLGGERMAVGADIVLNGRAFTVVGVAREDTPTPGGFARPQLWVPLAMHEVLLPTFEWRGGSLFHDRDVSWLSVLARLKDDVNLTRARADLRTLSRRNAPEEGNAGAWGFTLVPVERARLGPPSADASRRIAWLLLGVVGVVLLIACANVGNLMLTRTELRRREMAIRRSLGADGGRLFRQLLTESLVLTLIAGVVSVILALQSTAFLSHFWAVLGRGPFDIRLDGRVLFVALTLAILTGLAVGLLPALRGSSGEGSNDGGPPGSLRARAGGGIASRDTLVVAQMAFSVVVVVGATLMLRTVWNLKSAPLGFDLDGVRIVRVEPSSGLWTPEDEQGIQLRLVRALRRMPGVTSAALTFVAPLSGGRMAEDILWEPSGPDGNRNRMTVDMNVVGVDFFRIMGIGISRGRAFSRDDGPNSENVVVVNQALASRLWPGRDPVGQRLWAVKADGPDQALRVVGVVSNGRYYRSWQTADQPFVFLPASQNFYPNSCLVFRDGPGGGPTDGQVVELLQSVEPKLLNPRVVSLRESRDQAIAPARMTALLLVCFGTLALVLAVMGVYGVASYSVARRSHDLGVRIALGARRVDIGEAVLRGSAVPVLVGAAVGTAAAAALAPLLKSLLYGIRPTDPLTLGAVAGGLTLVGLLACVPPTVRAMRMDPMPVINVDP